MAASHGKLSGLQHPVKRGRCGVMGGLPCVPNRTLRAPWLWCSRLPRSNLPPVRAAAHPHRVWLRGARLFQSQSRRAPAPPPLPTEATASGTASSTPPMHPVAARVGGRMLPGVRAVGTGRAVLPSSVSLHFQRRRQQSAQLLPPRPCTLSQGGKESLHVLLAGHVLAWASRERLLQAAPLPSTTHRPHFPPNFSHMHPCLCWGANSLCVRLLSIYSLCFGSTQSKPLSCSALPPGHTLSRTCGSRASSLLMRLRLTFSRIWGQSPSDTSPAAASAARSTANVASSGLQGHTMTCR